MSDLMYFSRKHMLVAQVDRWHQAAPASCQEDRLTATQSCEVSQAAGPTEAWKPDHVLLAVYFGHCKRCASSSKHHALPALQCQGSCLAQASEHSAFMGTLGQGNKQRCILMCHIGQVSFKTTRRPFRIRRRTNSREAVSSV